MEAVRGRTTGLEAELQAADEKGRHLAESVERAHARVEELERELAGHAAAARASRRGCVRR
jgi:hypothetical protein